MSCGQGCLRWGGDAARRTAVRLSAGCWVQGAERVERGGEGRGPWPVDGEPQCWSAGAVGDPAGECEESGADGAGNDQLVLDAGVAADGGLADQVVSEDCALQPDAVGV